ncbi:hypothetical protein SAMN05446037_102813 [Anaerovirgula multivorans]|uniref:Uncharacterized protein n=1 Tax=Anaerovirgula multivorans TaxID=312168 RepID=A0A239IIK5_9FIRM|nr:hypothetical protein [Anaerovirgula multivorans]SNS92843.1 hypothetical protein SAMN05446037_102813 [Anaerovirgula multivorans]
MKSIEEYILAFEALHFLLKKTGVNSWVNWIDVDIELAKENCERAIIREMMRRRKFMLLRNIQNGKYGLGGEVYFELFKKYINFSADDGIAVEYIEKCAQYLNSLNAEVINSYYHYYRR